MGTRTDNISAMLIICKQKITIARYAHAIAAASGTVVGLLVVREALGLVARDHVVARLDVRHAMAIALDRALPPADAAGTATSTSAISSLCAVLPK